MMLRGLRVGKLHEDEGDGGGSYHGAQGVLTERCLLIRERQSAQGLLHRLSWRIPQGTEVMLSRKMDGYH